MALDKTEVGRLRRKASRVGLRLTKSRARHTHTNNFGGLMLLDLWDNTVVEGVNFELDTKTAEHWIDRYGRKRAR